MAKILNKDPVTYEKERDGFLKDLHHFHETRGTPFKRSPKIGGQEVDLYLLYVLVTAHGGWIKVNTRNEWASLCEQFHLPTGCVNSGVGLKQIYLRYLDRYEKVHYLGEDGQQADDDDEDSRHRKWSARALHSVPLTYNHHQHNVAESLRDYNGLSSDLYKPSNYDKLALSLLSPLPNEQDFAINVCTLLSNEGKHTLRLDKYPRLVNLLLAHAGIFDSPGTRQLFIEVYSRVRNYSINSFWSDVLDLQDVLDLTDERSFMKKPSVKNLQTFSRRKQLEKDKQKESNNNNSSNNSIISSSSSSTSSRSSSSSSSNNGNNNINNNDNNDNNGKNNDVAAVDNCNEETDNLLMDVDAVPECTRLDEIVINDESYKDQNENSIKFSEEDKDLFCVGRTLGTQDPYGQRVLQIASILRNLSFTPENAAVLGRNRCFLRFVLLCVRARWSNLHQLGFDILGNIANEIILKDAGERLSDVILSCVSSGIDSQDRFIIISCLEILNKISQQDSNEEILVFGLDDAVFELICRFLALSDIALLVYTLECLYALTSLGERPCTSVARVRGAIDTLVALVTVEAQSYGPKACILMRVVETVSTLATSTNSGQNNTTAANATNNATANATAVSSPSSSSSSSTSSTSTSTSSNSSSSVATAVVTCLPTVSTSATTLISSSSMSTSGTVSVTTITTATNPPPVNLASSRPSTPASTNTKSTTHKNAVDTTNSIQQQHAHQQTIQENEQFALGWLRATFELAPGVRIEQEELYKKYLGSCTKIGRRGVIAPLHFPRCVRTVFGGTIGPSPLKGESTGTQYYDGIRVRTTPGPITYSTQSILPTNSTCTASITGGLNASTIGGVKVSVSHPHLSQALLASGSQSHQPQLRHQYQQQQQQPQQQQQQQQHQPSSVQTIQVVVKEDARSGTTSSSIIKSLLATKVTVSSDCMSTAVVATCVSSTPTACVTNTTTASIASSISANQLIITSNQVAQRQQQQRLLQQQLSGVVQPTAPTATPATATTPLGKVAVNSKQQNPAIVSTPAKKVQRLNGAKFVVTNNCEKSEANEEASSHAVTPSSSSSSSTSSTSTIVTSAAPTTLVSSTTENYICSSQKSCRPPTITSIPTGTVTTTTTTTYKSINQRTMTTPVAEDSDSTNNSLASSSGIGGSRDCSGVGPEEENSLTSFEGILLNGVPTNLDIDVHDDNSSKDSSSIGSKTDNKPLQSMMLADLLEKKIDKEPIVNGVLNKNLINDKGIDLVENHIKRVLKESPTEMKIKSEIAEVSEDALIEAPSRGIKRTSSDSEEVDRKKLKYSNGTTSPDPTTIVESTISSIKSEEQDDDKDSEKVTVSSTAANLYAALAADCIEDEADLELEENQLIKEESTVIKEEYIHTHVEVPQQSQTPQLHQHQHQHQHQQQHQQQHQHQHQHQPQPQPQPQPQHQHQHQHQHQQQQLIVATAAPRQIVVQQTLQGNNQVIIPTVKTAATTRQAATQPQVLLQQSPSGQLQYVVSGGVPGQNYVLAQPQTALVQGQAQTVLVAQTTQQQGTGTKTIIILQPQTAAHQATTQKMVAVTPQGQQVVVTQVPRPMLQSPALGNIPPPLVPTSATIPQASIIVNNAVTTQNSPNVNAAAVTVTIPAAIAQQVPPTTNSVPSRVVTPTPASTPPPTRPTTPHQAAATTHGHNIIKQTPVKIVKTVNSSTCTEGETPKPSTSHQQAQEATTKTITIKIDPNAYLCEWRGCLRQFKTAHEVYLHVCEAHCPTGGEEILCLWASCDALKRRRFSLMTHLYDRHCNSEAMAMRRKQLTVTGKTEVSTATTPTQQHPGYAPNAAFHAIKRHALEFVNPKELMQRPSKPAAATSSSSSPRPGHNPSPEQDDNEGPVTKSIRLTAALILRNLVIYSAHGRRHLRAYEPHLAGVALSNVESSRTIAQVLYDMNDQSNSHHR